MTPQLSATAPFDRKTHRVDHFSCDEAALDRWLIAYVGQSQQRDAARTFVTTEPDGKVAGYCTLVAAQVEHEQATSTVRQGLSRHFPIPVALIARLAVTAQHQGTGLGCSLLLDALQVGFPMRPKRSELVRSESASIQNVPKRRGSNERSEAPAACPVRFSQVDAKRGTNREAVDVPRPRLARTTNLGQLGQRP